MNEQVKQAGQATGQQQGKRDLRQEITDRFVAALEQNQIPWEKPWESVRHGFPKNLASNREYNGGNRMMLMLEQMERGFADPRFGTMKQINDLGGRVNKGEHGIPVELWKDQPFWERPDVNITLAGKPVKVTGEKNGTVSIASGVTVKPDDLAVEYKGKPFSSWGKAHDVLDRAVAKVYVVFNVEQCSGLKIDPLHEQPRLPVDARGEQMIRAMAKDGVVFKQHAEAFYSPKNDEIYLPARDAFKSQEGYYGTALHEIGHATGAQRRLNRDGITGGHRFGSEGYAKEELRAELFSTFMAAQTGIPHDEEQHRAYVQSWAKALKDDKNELFRAAAEAGKAVDYVLEKERALQQEQAHEFYEETVYADLPEIQQAWEQKQSQQKDEPAEKQAAPIEPEPADEAKPEPKQTKPRKSRSSNAGVSR